MLKINLILFKSSLYFILKIKVGVAASFPFCPHHNRGICPIVLKLFICCFIIRLLVCWIIHFCILSTRAVFTRMFKLYYMLCTIHAFYILFFIFCPSLMRVVLDSLDPLFFIHMLFVVLWYIVFMTYHVPPNLFQNYIFN